MLFCKRELETDEILEIKQKGPINRISKYIYITKNNAAMVADICKEVVSK